VSKAAAERIMYVRLNVAYDDGWRKRPTGWRLACK
jgi:hypothetical protein